MKQFPDDIVPRSQYGAARKYNYTTILQMLADGKTHKQIGHAIGMPVKNLAHVMTKIKRTVGCRTSAHVVALALRRGWID